jgi:hypothetical protein
MVDLAVALVAVALEQAELVVALELQTKVMLVVQQPETAVVVVAVRGSLVKMQFQHHWEATEVTVLRPVLPVHQLHALAAAVEVLI